MLTPPRIGSLFAGYGGLDMGAQAVLGGDLAWYSEVEPAAVKVLQHHHPNLPNLGDITKVEWADVEPVDMLTGGFPCQDVSSAGKRVGMRPNSRSGLWTHMARAIAVLRPQVVLIENVRGLLSAEAASDLEPCPWCLGDERDRPLRALGAVLGDLAVLGYDARWHGLRAADAGAPHGRFRVFIVAWPAADPTHFGHERGRDARGRWPGPADGSDHPAAYPDRAGREGPEPTVGRHLPARGAAADPKGIGRREGRPEPARLVGRPDVAERGERTPAHADGDGLAVVGQGPEPDARDDTDGCSPLRWGDYEPAIRRWEHALGQPAPAPTQAGQRGGQQLSPRFVEWLMGLPEGHVTSVPGLSRNEQLKLLGNGVVPAQAALALRRLLSHDLSRFDRYQPVAAS